MIRAVALILIVLAGEASATDPATSGLVAVNGTELFVRRVGTGEPVVVVHGGPVMDHGYFLPHLYPLAESVELIFYDQRASGRSVADVDPETMRVETFLDDIDALRAALELGPIHVLGHSWGGYLAMRYALREPAHVRSLMLVSSMPASTKRWEEEELAVAALITAEDTADRAALRESDGFAAGDPATLAELLRLSFRPQFHDPSRLGRLELYVPGDYAERSARAGGLMQDLMSFDHHDELGELTVPTLIVYGEMEPGADIGGAAIHERVTGSEYVRIADAGHFPFVERPEVFLAAVRKFMSTIDGE